MHRSLLPCFALIAAAALAADAARKTFDLPADNAEKSLRLFSAQSGLPVIFPTEVTRGVRTPAVRGELPVREALDRLLAGTGLVAVRDERNGTFSVRRADGPNAEGAAPTAGDRPATERNAGRPAAGAAQSAAGDAPVELSPFVITATSEAGWIATETLAGSRIRTDLRDVPNQIETLTKEFMDDLGLTSFDEALIYTANVENKSEYSGGAGNDSQFPGEAGRVRGLGIGGATLSRNFFQTRSPTDNYNLDRATVANGPNAILFGLGSPAGILDATPARALMRNRYGFTLQYDSEESKRATFDANAVILPQRLSFRLMGLSKKTHTEKKPNLDRNDRTYATLTFKPFKDTTLILQGERNSRTWNRAGQTVPFDFVTPWLHANQVPGGGYAAPKPIYDNSSLAGIGANRVFVQGTENPVMIQGEGTALRSWRNSVTVRNPSTLPGVDPTFDAGANTSLLDPAIFPFDVNVLGHTRANNLDSYHKTVLIEHKLARQLFLELAYNRERANNEILTVGGNPSGTGIRVMADANRFIPGTTTPNPHAGEYYVQGTSANRLQYFRREDWRATLSYELDLARRLGPRGAWLRWLGRHRLSGLYAASWNENLNQNTFQYRILDDPAIPGVTLRPRTFQNWANHASRIPQYRHYLGDPYAPALALGPLKAAAWTIADASGRPLNLHLLETPLRSPEGKRLAAQAAANGVRNQVRSAVFVWQGFFLPDRAQRDRLVVTYGYRQDRARSAGFDAASTTQDFSGLYPVLWDATFAGYGPAERGVNRNFGVVGRPVRWLSLSYNQSTSFDLNLDRYDPFGLPLPGAGGEGRDYGVRLDLWRDKLALKINKYETGLGPARAIQQINNYQTQLMNIERRVAELDPAVPQINVRDGNQRGFPTLSVPQSYNINSDFSGQGYEVELNFRPTRSWSIRLNGAKGESTETNIGADWFKWIDLRLPVWQAVVARNGEVDGAGRPVTWNTAPFSASQPDGRTLAQYYQGDIVGRMIAFIKAVEGRSNPSVRDGRVNLIANHTFHEGRLKGLNVGGAFRYRAAPVIGYGVKRSAAGETVLDLDKKYEGEAERYVDFMAGYRGRLKAFGGVNYRLQLNIRNLLNAHDPVPIEALTTGAINRLVTVDRRLTAITFGVDF